MQINNIMGIEPWYEPVDFLRSKKDFRCEMTRGNHGFLCGMIKKTKPNKLVEIGVAEGGTTSIIMNALAMLKLESHMWSVDLNKRFYMDDSIKTGYEYDKLKKYIGGESTHQFLLGKSIASQIDKIGKNIDMVILDTVHKLPGEILDFLAILPYLSPNAVIILHDINLNYVRGTKRGKKNNRQTIIRSREDIATKVLWQTVAADKYISINNIEEMGIGAFRVNDDTYKYIQSIFFSLTLTWSYNVSEIEEYRDIYKKYYNDECLKLFDIAVHTNRRLLERMNILAVYKEDTIPVISWEFPYEKIPAESNIVLYGAGHVGKEIHTLIGMSKYCNIVAWVDKEYNSYMLEELNVENPANLGKINYDYILVAVGEQKTFNEIKKEILQNNSSIEEKRIIGPLKCW